MSKLFDLFPQELKDQVVKHRLEGTGFASKDYAFQRVRKLPLLTPRNVQSAMTHMLNVKGVSCEEISEAFKKIIEKAVEFKICTMGFEREYDQYLNTLKESLKTE
jgi:hypothetical protein